MTYAILGDILRGLVTNVMYMTLLTIMGQLKYNKKKTAIFIILVVCIDVAFNIFFYLKRDYTNLAKFELVIIIIACIISIPIFKVRFMSWLFNFITVTNAYIIIVVLSYTMSRYMPFPPYSHTLLRFLFFFLLIILYRRYAHFINQKIQEQWRIFFLTSAVILANFSYYIFFKGNIEAMMKENIVQLMLLITLAIITYIGVFITLKTMSSEYELKEKNLLIKANEELMLSQMNYMQNMLKIIDESTKKSRIENHDRRHFDNTIMELLQSDMTEKAIELLKEKSKYASPVQKKFCINTTVNAAITYYASVAEKKSISFNTRLDIPEKLSVNELELSIVTSNLLENAIHACEKISDFEKRYINFTFVSQPQIVFEIENPYVGNVLMDNNGYPVSESEGHGLGTKSVMIFVDNYDGQLVYNKENGIFRVRVILYS